MPSIKVVVDTNVLAGKNSFDTLFGNRKELKKILEIPGTELVVPSIVIDELLHQKSAAFKTAKSRLVESSYYKQRVSDDIKSRVESDGIDLNSLRSDTSITYRAIDITNKADALNKICQLATNYQAPFQVYSDGKDNSDKGFKDSYIALTIDEYLGQLKDSENIFLLTKDARLAEYFQDNSRVVRVQSYDEINSQIDRPALDTITISQDGSTGAVRPLSQERVATQALLTNFRNSGSFATTHSLVSKLSEASKANKLTDADYVDMLVSATQNNQIAWLLGDIDIRELIIPVFEKNKDKLTPWQYNTIVQGADLGYPPKADQPTPSTSLDDIPW